MLLIYIQNNFFICSQRPESMVVVCLVQNLMLLEELKQSNPLKRDWNILGFDNYCL